MSDLIGNHEDRFSYVAVQFISFAWKHQQTIFLVGVTRIVMEMFLKLEMTDDAMLSSTFDDMYIFIKKNNVC